MYPLYGDDADRALFLEGLLEAETAAAGEAGAPLPWPFDLGFLATEVLAYPRSMRVLARAGHDRELVETAEKLGAAGVWLDVADATVEHLDDDSLAAVMDALGWFNLDAGRYGRYVAALRRRPYALILEASDALASLSQAETASAAHLQEVLEAALDAAQEAGPGDLEALSGGEGLDRLQRLLRRREKRLRRLALRWAEILEPDEDLISLLVERRTAARSEEDRQGLTKVLRGHALSLASRAKDTSLGWEERAGALGLALLADGGVARDAAFALAETPDAHLRSAAAQALAATEGRPEDEQTLRDLLDNEGDSAVAEGLQAALRNISSGNVPQAVENLFVLVGLPEVEADPRVFVPAGEWDARFVECVDSARRRRGGDPGAYVGALNRLAELLVEEAVVERHDADPETSPLGKKGVAQAEAIRANRRSKPDLGDLIRRPTLMEAFPWLHHVHVLRAMRDAHPSPVGSMVPVRVEDNDAAHAQRLFRDVVEGWTASMQETRNLRS